MDAATRPLLVIVDDDPLITDSLGYVFASDYEVVIADSRPHCIELLRSRGLRPRAALVDLGLPPTPHRPDEGLALISELLAHSPQVKIVVLSGQQDEAHARRARALGAAEFVSKPADPDALHQALKRVLCYESVEGQSTAGASGDFQALVGKSEPMRKLRAQIARFADSPFPVLIQGESGSGKDVVASVCLHKLAARSDKPFLALNCAAISPALVEPTLFGHAKGAFTGAVGARAGYFEEAADGTLLLDEIGELPLELQPKLLRVLENGEYQRVGETQPRISRARIVAATNRDLRREVSAGRFRADLYHRLSVFTVSVPPLRDLGDDRLTLLDHYRLLFARQTRHAPIELDRAALALWREYAFPGNVRELRNIIIRLTTKFPGKSISREELESEVDLLACTANTATYALAPPQRTSELGVAALDQLKRHGGFNLDDTLRQWEQAYIEAALSITRGNVSQAAKLLGIHRTTLYNRMEVLGRSNSG